MVRKLFPIYLDESEKKYLKKKAEKEKRKLSDFMRCELLKDKKIAGWNKNERN